jgi:hypothetical protein
LALYFYVSIRLKIKNPDLIILNQDFIYKPQVEYLDKFLFQ